MKVKTSITLSEDLLESIDRHSASFKSRSEFLEVAARGFLARLAKAEAEQRDREIIEKRAEALNAEAADVLSYQVRL